MCSVPLHFHLWNLKGLLSSPKHTGGSFLASHAVHQSLHLQSLESPESRPGAEQPFITGLELERDKVHFIDASQKASRDDLSVLVPQPFFLLSEYLQADDQIVKGTRPGIGTFSQALFSPLLTSDGVRRIRILIILPGSCSVRAGRLSGLGLTSAVAAELSVRL